LKLEKDIAAKGTKVTKNEIEMSFEMNAIAPMSFPRKRESRYPHEIPGFRVKPGMT